MGILDTGIVVIDVTRLGKRVLKSTYKIDEKIAASAFAGKAMLVITKSKIRFLDVSNPDKPVEADTIPIQFFGIINPVVIGSNIFVFAAPSEGSPDIKGNKMVVFKAYDASDPAHPRKSGEYIGESGMQASAAANGNYVFLIHEIRENKGKYYLDIYDVSDLNNIKMLTRYETDKRIDGLQVMGDHVILIEGGELVVLRVSG